MLVYVFPGQGSQFKGMGADLFSEYKDLITTADQVLGYSIEQLCINDPNDQLNQTHYTQPALFVVNALSYLKQIATNGTKPNFTAGHSLGEYNALYAAGVFDFETGLRLVKKRGELMSHANGGSMAAVIGLKKTEVDQILTNNSLTTISVANDNSYTQVVITGLKNDIEIAQPIFLKSGASLFIPLKVSGAFHSPYMRDAQNEFATYLNSFEFKSPTIPVIANINALPYSADLIKSNLANQITHPVLWTESIKNLIDQGATSFDEVGPGKVLTGLINRIKRGQ